MNSLEECYEMLDQAYGVIKELMAVLPDSCTDTCFEWAWNELSDPIQDDVKIARKMGQDFIEKICKFVPSFDGQMVR